jgi:hypothetical protein
MDGAIPTKLSQDKSGPAIRAARTIGQGAPSSPEIPKGRTKDCQCQSGAQKVSTTINFDPPTHWEPSRFVPGRHLLRRASGGRFWRGFAARLAACMDARLRCDTDAMAARSGQAMQRKWRARTKTTLSICFRRRKSLTSAVYRGEPSIGPSLAVSCEQRDSATGSGCIRGSWIAGLPRKRRLPPRRCRGRRGGLFLRRGAAACERCSMRQRRRSR